MSSIWIIRSLFLLMCTTAGYAVSQVRPEYLSSSHGLWVGMAIGFGFGWLLIGVDEMLKGFSLRAFSATTFGLLLGTVVALLIDRSGLFETVSEMPTRWLIRLCLFLGFGYIGIILAMRSNKEDFSLIIPYVRFAPRNQPENLLLFDTSVVIDGRIADLIDANFIQGVAVVPGFVIKELQHLADATDPTKRARGRRGLDILARIRRNQKIEVKIHDAEVVQEQEVDGKLVWLAKTLNAKLFTNDSNLVRVAELQSVTCVNIHEVARILRPVLLPGEVFSLRLVREGKDKGQAVGYTAEGTMVVVNNAQNAIGQQAEVQVQSLLQTGAGVIIFADLKSVGEPAPAPAATPPGPA